MKIPPNPSGKPAQSSQSLSGKTRPSSEALSLEAAYVETIRSQVAKNPLAALNALSPWRDPGAGKELAAVRWPTEAFPLKVWVAKMPEHIQLPEKWVVEVMRQWEVGSGGLIRLRGVEHAFAGNADEADIRVFWETDTVLGRDYEVGHAKRDVANQRIQQVTITLIEAPLIDRQLSSWEQRNRLIATILHETGHALGLEHSDSAQDVMYYRGWKNTQLSVQDLQRLNALYQSGGYKA